MCITRCFCGEGFRQNISQGRTRMYHSYIESLPADNMTGRSSGSVNKQSQSYVACRTITALELASILSFGERCLIAIAQ